MQSKKEQKKQEKQEQKPAPKDKEKQGKKGEKSTVPEAQASKQEVSSQNIQNEQKQHYLKDQTGSNNEIPNSLQLRLDPIKTKKIPTIQEMFHKYQSKGVEFSMLELSYQIANDQIQNATFCQSIIEIMKEISVRFKPCETRAFREGLRQKLSVFKAIMDEFNLLNYAAMNIFNYIVLILESMNVVITFEDARDWFVRRLTRLITEKFTNSEIILLENVS